MVGGFSGGLADGVTAVSGGRGAGARLATLRQGHGFGATANPHAGAHQRRARRLDEEGCGASSDSHLVGRLGHNTGSHQHRQGDAVHISITDRFREQLGDDPDAPDPPFQGGAAVRRFHQSTAMKMPARPMIRTTGSRAKCQAGGGPGSSEGLGSSQIATVRRTVLVALLASLPERAADDKKLGFGLFFLLVNHPV